MSNEFDAFSRPRVTRPGCQHNLGCRCEPPYWLRASTPVEVKKEYMYRMGSMQLDEILRDLRAVEARRDELTRRLAIYEKTS